MADIPLSLQNLPGLQGAGNTPGIKDLSAGLDAIRGATLPDIFNSPQFAQIQGLLGPGPNGGLSSSLAALYGLGQQKLGLQRSANVASAKSDALGRGLEGSTIEGYEVGNANLNSDLAEQALLSSLFGMQNQNQGQLASYLYGGLGMEGQNYLDLLRQALGIYETSSTNTGNYEMFNTGLEESKREADAANRTALYAAGIQAAGSIGGGFASR